MFAIFLLCFTLILSFSLALEGCNVAIMVRPNEVRYIESPYYPRNAPVGITCAWYITCPPSGQCFFDCDDVQMAQSDRLVLSTRGGPAPYYFGNKVVNDKSFSAKSDDFRFSLGFVTSPSSTGSRFKCRMRSEYLPEINIDV